MQFSKVRWIPDQHTFDPVIGPSLLDRNPHTVTESAGLCLGHCDKAAVSDIQSFLKGPLDSPSKNFRATRGPSLFVRN